jgi:hypothetical protein
MDENSFGPSDNITNEQAKPASIQNPYDRVLKVQQNYREVEQISPQRQEQQVFAHDAAQDLSVKEQKQDKALNNYNNTNRIVPKLIAKKNFNNATKEAVQATFANNTAQQELTQTNRYIQNRNVNPEDSTSKRMRELQEANRRAGPMEQSQKSKRFFQSGEPILKERFKDDPYKEVRESATLEYAKERAKFVFLYNESKKEDAIEILLDEHDITILGNLSLSIWEKLGNNRIGLDSSFDRISTETRLIKAKEELTKYSKEIGDPLIEKEKFRIMNVIDKLEKESKEVKEINQIFGILAIGANLAKSELEAQGLDFDCNRFVEVFNNSTSSTNVFAGELEDEYRNFYNGLIAKNHRNKNFPFRYGLEENRFPQIHKALSQNREQEYYQEIIHKDQRPYSAATLAHISIVCNYNEDDYPRAFTYQNESSKFFNMFYSYIQDGLPLSDHYNEDIKTQKAKKQYSSFAEILNVDQLVKEY